MAAIVAAVEGKINKVIELEEVIKAKEKRVLDKEDEILNLETQIFQIIHDEKVGRAAISKQ